MEAAQGVPAGLTAPMFVLRIAVSLLLGAIIGIERQWRQRNAGLRTNALVSVGTTLFVAITPLESPAGGNVFQIVSYVVSGIGFLAGGVIFKERLSVSGLNTAATLWCTAAVGALVGFGFVFEAVVGVLAILAANVALRPLARLVNQRPMAESDVLTSYEVHVICSLSQEEHARKSLVDVLRLVKLPMIALYTERLSEGERVEVIADITVPGGKDARLEAVIERLAVIGGVSSASWRRVPTSADEEEVLSQEN